jgi:hypothetical protein
MVIGIKEERTEIERRNREDAQSTANCCKELSN